MYRPVKLLFIVLLASILIRTSIASQDICRSDTSFTDIIFLIDNSQSIDNSEYSEFEQTIRRSINKVQEKCTRSQVAVVHYGGARGAETIVEYNLSATNVINGIERQYCTERDPITGNCIGGGGDDLNHAIGDIIDYMGNGSLNRNPLNKLVLVIFTDAFGFEESCGFSNCSVIRPFTNIDRLKRDFGASVTVVGASSQAEASLLAIYASPGGNFDNVTLFAQDCPSTFDGCQLPRKYIPIEFSSDSEVTADSVLSCVTCTVEIISGISVDAGTNRSICGDQNESTTLSASVVNGTAPVTYTWNQGLGDGQMKTVTPSVTTTYTVMATDANGCTASDQVTITVETCIPPCSVMPILTIPGDYVACPGTSTDVSVTGQATAIAGSPDCPSPTIMFMDMTMTEQACNRIIKRMWLAKYPGISDMALEAIGEQTITLTDTQDPIFTDFPADITVPSGEDCRAIVTWSEIIATDNCGTPIITSTRENGSAFDIGVSFVDFTATDGCGRTATRRLTITVTDNCCRQNPTITCPPSYIGCPGQNIDPAVTGMPTALPGGPDCPTPTITFSDQTISETACETIINRTWTASYTAAGQTYSASCIQEIRLVDEEAPVFISFPDDIIIESNSSCVAGVIWTAPTATDDCGMATIISTITNGSNFDIGVTFVDFTATDGCGRTATRRLTITVTDNCCRQNPTITCPPSYIGCPGQNIDPAVTGMPTALPGGPDCPTPTITFSDQTISETACETIINRTWTASYTAAGQTYSASCIQEIRLVDEEAPVFVSFPDDIVIESNSSCVAGVIWVNPTAEDNCSATMISSSLPNGSTFDIGVSFVDFTITDACGMTASRQLRITVIDNCCQAAPLITCPADFLGCPESSIMPTVTGLATGTPGGDDCPDPTISFEDVIIADSLCETIIDRIWTASYTAGTATFETACTQRILLRDNEAPIFSSFPSDIIVDSDESCSRGVFWTSPVVEDNCQVFAVTSTVENGTRFEIGVHIVDFTAEDGCGNITAQTLTITVLDNCCQEPPILNCPGNFADCPTSSANPNNTGMATALPGGEDCPNPIVTFSDSIINANPCTRMIARTWTASYPGLSDASLVSSCVQMISLQDTVAPTIVECLPDITLDPNHPILDYEDAVVSDACSYNLSYSLARGTVMAEGVHEVMVIATDACDNTSTCSFFVTVPPRVMIECPDDVQLFCVDSLDLNQLPEPIVKTNCVNCGMPIEGFTFLGQREGTSYYISKKVKNWPNAMWDAQKEGLQLVVINDAEENAYLTSLITENSVFIGLSDRYEEGVFTWVDGSPLTYANWFLDQPNNYGNAQDYVELMNNGYWNDQSNNKSLKYIIEVPCVEVTRSIVNQTRDGRDDVYTIQYLATDKCDTRDSCEIEVRVSNDAFITCPADLEIYSPYGFTRVSWEEPVFTTCCTTCNPKQVPGYLYMGRIGDSFYYCSYARASWATAKYRAQEIGGHLVTIDNKEENDFLAQGLIDRNAFIGLSDVDIEGKMTWADGSSASYRNWDGGRPNNSEINDFVEMGISGKWTLVDKSVMREFIVEVKGCNYVTHIGGPKNGSIITEGTHTVTYRAADGCGNVDTCSFEITVIKGASARSNDHKSLSPNALAIDKINLYPNPVRNLLYINSAEGLDVNSEAQIINHTGQIIRNTTVKRLLDGLDVSDLTSGLHFIRIANNEGKSLVEKFIVE